MFGIVPEPATVPENVGEAIVGDDVKTTAPLPTTPFVKSRAARV